VNPGAANKPFDREHGDEARRRSKGGSFEDRGGRLRAIARIRALMGWSGFVAWVSSLTALVTALTLGGPERVVALVRSGTLVGVLCTVLGVVLLVAAIASMAAGLVMVIRLRPWVSALRSDARFCMQCLHALCDGVVRCPECGAAAGDETDAARRRLSAHQVSADLATATHAIFITPLITALAAGLFLGFAQFLPPTIATISFIAIAPLMLMVVVIRFVIGPRWIARTLGRALAAADA